MLPIASLLPSAPQSSTTLHLLWLIYTRVLPVSHHTITITVTWLIVTQVIHSWDFAVATFCGLHCHGHRNRRSLPPLALVHCCCCHSLWASSLPPPLPLGRSADRYRSSLPCRSLPSSSCSCTLLRINRILANSVDSCYLRTERSVVSLDIAVSSSLARMNE